jgi:acyl carrier protein
MSDTERERVAAAVKRLVARESRLSIDPGRIPGSEPLDGPLLRVTSVGLLGMFIRLEDELSLTLPDDLFVGRVLYTVDDIVDVVAGVAEGAGQRAPS